MTVSRAADGAFIFRDDAANATAGSGCTAVDPSSVRCALPPSARFRARDGRGVVRAGDLNDVAITAAGTPVRLYGGEGDDVLRGDGTLHGDAGADTLEGGALPDTLFGGPGDDVLRGGAGGDFLDGDATEYGKRDAAGGDDVLDGGPGVDTVTYERRLSAVAVNLGDPSPDGGPGERDTLLAIEGVTGSAAGDVLVGDDAANALNGEAGDDRVEGRGGNDQLTDGRGVDSVQGEDGEDLVIASGPGDLASGGPGADWVAGGLGGSGMHLDGGPGADRLSFFDRPRTTSCGAGDDVVAANQLDGLRLDGCEEVRLGAFDLFEAAVKPTRRSSRTVGLRVKCRARGSTTIRRCRGTVTLRLRRRGAKPLTLGRRAFSVAEAHSGEVRVRVRRQHALGCAPPPAH